MGLLLVSGAGGNDGEGVAVVDDVFGAGGHPSVSGAGRGCAAGPAQDTGRDTCSQPHGPWLGAVCGVLLVGAHRSLF